MLSSFRLGLFASTLAMTAAPIAAQVTITSDDVLRVHFVTSPPFNTTPDVLSLGFGVITVNSAFTRRNAEVFDCGVSLGVHSDSQFGSHVGALSLNPTNTFRSPSSVYTFLNPAPIDFSSIVNGSIRGIIQFTIDSGSITLPSLSQVTLRLNRATGGSSGIVVSPAPTILSVEVAPRMTLTPAALNVTNTLSVTGAVPGSTMFFGFGTICGQLPLPCPGAPFYDVANPIAFVADPVDANGNASTSFFVPNTTAGLTFMMQGIELNLPGCLRSTSLVPITF